MLRPRIAERGTSGPRPRVPPPAHGVNRKLHVGLAQSPFQKRRDMNQLQLTVLQLSDC